MPKLKNLKAKNQKSITCIMHFDVFSVSSVVLVWFYREPVGPLNPFGFGTGVLEWWSSGVIGSRLHVTRPPLP